MTRINTEFTGEIQRLIAPIVRYAEGGCLNIEHMRMCLVSKGWVNTPCETQTEDTIEMCHALGFMSAVRMWIKVCPYRDAHEVIVGLDEVAADRPGGHGFAVLFQNTSGDVE